MTERHARLVGIASVLVGVGLTACSGSDTGNKTSGATGGVGATAPSTGGSTGGATSPTGGAATGGVIAGGTPSGGVATGGDSDGGANTGGVGAGGANTGGAETGGSGGSVAPINCASSGEAQTGVACTADCDVGCGFDGIGRKHCTCGSDGTYSSCPCDPPAEYPHVDEAPADYCIDVIGGVPVASGTGGGGGADGTGSMVNGSVDDYDETPCVTEWERCITAEDDSTPRGCLCLPDGDGGLRWSCGSTNNWFARPVEGGGEGGAGGSGGASAEVMCPGSPSSSADCPAEAISNCTNDCGVHSLGRRTCSCNPGETWDCTSCVMSSGPFVTPPTAEICCQAVSGAGGAGVVEQDACSEEGLSCIEGPDDLDRVCGCYGGVWDCASRPNEWGSDPLACP